MFSNTGFPCHPATLKRNAVKFPLLSHITPTIENLRSSIFDFQKINKVDTIFKQINLHLHLNIKQLAKFICNTV